MVRGYFIYILMFVAAGMGLWAILRAGERLQAPAEIAGQWNVRWETLSPTGGDLHGTMSVNQSGRYCTFHFDGSRTLCLKMVQGSALGHGDPQQPAAQLVGEGYQMTLRAAASPETMLLELSGRDHHRGVAERLNRPSERASAPAPAPFPVADARH